MTCAFDMAWCNWGTGQSCKSCQLCSWTTFLTKILHHPGGHIDRIPKQAITGQFVADDASNHWTWQRSVQLLGARGWRDDIQWRTCRLQKYPHQTYLEWRCVFKNFHTQKGKVLLIFRRFVGKEFKQELGNCLLLAIARSFLLWWVRCVFLRWSFPTIAPVATLHSWNQVWISMDGIQVSILQF